MWKWGGGFLNELGFYDFAGSTLVHSVGGWGALVGVIFLGPRLGKYKKDRIMPIPGHSMPLAAIGVFLLWLGWFGFNGGSVLSADAGLVSLVLVTTSLAAGAGAIGAMIASWTFLKKPDITMVLNGILAGLVGITAGADLMTPVESMIIGFISGIIVVFSVLFFDKIKLDDPVGALSVHLVCGIFGRAAKFSAQILHGLFGQIYVADLDHSQEPHGICGRGIRAAKADCMTGSIGPDRNFDVAFALIFYCPNLTVAAQGHGFHGKGPYVGQERVNFCPF